MARCQVCGVEGIQALYCRACGEQVQHTKQYEDNVKKRRHALGQRKPPWSKRAPLSELLRKGDDEGVKQRLDDFAGDFADVLLDQWEGRTGT